MTDQHPITPPPELRRLWAQEAQRISPHDPVEWMQYVSEKAAQWGANTELKKCCEWLESEPDPGHVDLLRSCATDLARWRRPAIQPEPEELTDEEILKIHDQFDIDGTEDVTKGMPLDVFWDSYQPQQRIAFARAIIAADRAQWGRPATTETP